MLLAVSPAAVGHGVLVAMDDDILSDRDVMKTSNHKLSTFKARDHGPLGDIDAYGNVFFYRKLLRQHTVDSRFATDIDGYGLPLSKVEIIPVYAGVDGAGIDAAITRGARGIVAASPPPSLNPTVVDEAVTRATDAGLAVVQASRAISGRVVQRRGFDARRVVASDTLSPQAARLLLMLCLASGLDYDETVEAFVTY